MPPLVRDTRSMWEFHIPRIDIWGYLAGVAVGVAMVVDVVGYMLKLAVGVAVVW